jgi:hypothetical protein
VQVYGIGRALDDRALFQGLGFHIASEQCADQEFKVLDRYLRNRFPDLVARLAGVTEPWGHNGYHWIQVHCNVEDEHRQSAAEAVRLALDFYAGDLTSDRVIAHLVEGFKTFIETQEAFFRNAAIPKGEWDENGSPLSFRQKQIMDKTKAQIVLRMEEYIKSTLEQRREAFGGLSACPFVRTERTKNRIRYEICPMVPGEPSEEILVLIRNFANDRDHSTLLIIDPWSPLTQQGGVAYGMRICERLRDIEMIAICVYPGDPLEIAGFRPRRKIPYVTMLVQTAELVRNAKRSLHNTNYYSKWSQEDIEYNWYQFARFL